MTRKILRLSFNTLTANDKYSLLNRDKLTQPIQMHLSQKEKHFAEYNRTFFKLTLNFHNFQKTNDPNSLYISDITDSETHG